MTGNIVDLDQPLRGNGGSEVRGPPSTVGVVPLAKEAWQLRQVN